MKIVILRAVVAGALAWMAASVLVGTGSPGVLGAAAGAAVGAVLSSRRHVGVRVRP